MRFLLTHPVLSLSSECQSFLHPRANIHAHVLSLIYTTDVALEDIVQYKMNSGTHGGGFGAGGDDGPANPLDAFASLACQMDGTATAPKPMPTLFEESGDEDARPVRVKARQSVDDYQLVRVLGKGCVGKVRTAIVNLDDGRCCWHVKSAPSDCLPSRPSASIGLRRMGARRLNTPRRSSAFWPICLSADIRF
jgi:hypothetical protein